MDSDTKQMLQKIVDELENIGKVLQVIAEKE